MMFSELLEWMPLLNTLPSSTEPWGACLAVLVGLARHKDFEEPLLVQEQTGFHLGITPGIKATGRHAAQIAANKYQAWLDGDGSPDDTEFKHQYFTIAVGGGNTVKNEYKALLRYHLHDIGWLEHVRFFFLEETCNADNWESTRTGLVTTFLEPLAKKLISSNGTRELTETLGLKRSASHGEIIDQVVELMTYPINASAVERSIRRSDHETALGEAQREARRYQALVRKLLGPSMSFHLIITGFGSNGGIGAFPPYTPELKKKKPSVIVVENPDGPISIALNRGVLTAAECVSLIVSGSLKLRALGRFEMDDSAAFEQTVMETPIRMLRESHAIAEKVYIFADDRALHFDEGEFQYKQDGTTIKVKSELRDGEEPGGIHILLVHGFMGLYSYINLLIRLPSAWRVSALRRGKHAKTLPDDEVFPHYANSIRKMILKNWHSRRPTPICCHSFAGCISDHLLLSVLEDYHDPLPDFDKLKAEDRRLVEAMQASGLIHIATWAPSDLGHVTPNFEKRRAKKRGDNEEKLTSQKEIYELSSSGELILKQEHREKLVSTPAVLDTIMKIPGLEGFINTLTVGVRYLAKKVNVTKLLKHEEAPYGQRLLGDRVLNKVSFYGVLKEVKAATHDTAEYHDRHLKALQAIIKYDIPCLVLIHREDLMVSANRHAQEHQYLLAGRLEKEGVKREQDLKVPVRLILLDRNKNEPSDDMIDPHFLILSTTRGGGSNARKVTAAITSFVHENVARSIAAGRVEPLESVEKWVRKNKR
jgi:6-phosphogluconolactonase/glucosamine-6-phosphate isomerase/deaminase